MGKTITVRHDIIHYLEFGQGEPVVLVPSLWVTSKSYVALAKQLGKKYRVLVPDIYRGNSIFSTKATSLDEYVDMLALFIERMNLKKYYLIGVSLSGITTCKFVLNYSNRPKKLFLISTTVLPLNIKRPRMTLFLGYLRLLYHNFFSLDGISINWLWISDGLENAWKHFWQAWQEGLIATSLSIENIYQLPVPTKLVFANRDEFIPFETIDRLSKIRNLNLEVVNGYHAWFFHHENELTEKIFHFFD